MKLQDFQNSKCSYPAHIPFSIAWSEDDFVAMATEKGVYVTEIRPQKLKTPILSTKRYFVSNNKFLPTQNCGINIEELIKVLDQKGTYDLLQDITMSPALLRKNPFFPSVKYTAWSPVLSKQKLRSLLTILNDGGSLDIYYLWRETWTCAASVSKLWHKYCSSQWTKPPRDGKDILKELKSRSYKIKFSAFAWGTLFNKNSCDLFVGSFDGTLSIWSVKQDVKTRNVNVDLLKEFPTEDFMITALYCQNISTQKYIILMCFIDGRIGSLVLDLNEENKAPKPTILWDEKDKIQIHSGGLFSRMCIDSSSSTVVVQVAKGRHILVLCVNLEGALLSQCVVNTQELFISGMVSLSPTDSLITGYSGAAYLLTLQDFVPSLTKLQESLRTMHYSCNGLALSRSKCIAVLPFSVKTNYDHLTMKDLSNMLWCSLYDLPELHDILSKHSGPVSDIWDAFELLRIESLLKTNLITWNITSEDLDTMDTNNLKKNLLLLQLSILLDNSGDKSSTEDKKKIEKEIHDLLISCHIFKKVSHLITEPTLSDFEMISLFLMKKWIDYILTKYTSKYNHTATVAATLKEQINHVHNDLNQELCTICGNEVKMIDTMLLMSACTLGHTVPRCLLSLVQCSDIPYYSCYRCNTSAHINAVSEEDYCCIFCDNILRLSEMVLSDEEMNTNHGAQ